MPILEEVRTVTADGRVVIPWVIQRALGLEHGGPVRFRVENGVVTVSAVDARKPGAARAPGARDPGASEGDQPRRTDIRTELTNELNALLEATERDRANQAISQ